MAGKCGDLLLAEGSPNSNQEQEEIYWLRHGRTNWLMHGDRNTSLFHRASTVRKNHNHIKKLGDAGNWQQGTDELSDLITSYFTNICLQTFK